jgi:hypothetical protein
MHAMRRSIHAQQGTRPAHARPTRPTRQSRAAISRPYHDALSNGNGNGSWALKGGWWPPRPTAVVSVGSCGDDGGGGGFTPHVIYAILGGLFVMSETLGLTKRVPHNSVTDVVLHVARALFETDHAHPAATSGIEDGPTPPTPTPAPNGTKAATTVTVKDTVKDIEDSVDKIMDAIAEARASGKAKAVADALPKKSDRGGGK